MMGVIAEMAGSGAMARFESVGDGSNLYKDLAKLDIGEGDDAPVDSDDEAGSSGMAGPSNSQNDGAESSSNGEPERRVVVECWGPAFVTGKSLDTCCGHNSVLIAAEKGHVNCLSAKALTRG